MTTRDNPSEDSKTARSTVMGVFVSQQQADTALAALQATGFEAAQVSVVTSSTRGTHPTVEDGSDVPPTGDMGVLTEAQAEAYTEQVNHGASLLHVNAFDEAQAARAAEIFVRQGGEDVRTYAAGTGSLRAAPAIPPDYVPDSDRLMVVDYALDEG
jgi:hypothetical protein